MNKERAFTPGIKIVYGKQGFHLKVNGLFLYYGFGSGNSKDIKMIDCKSGIPVGATEWVSIRAIRNIWNIYRIMIVDATSRPYKHVGPFAVLEPVN